LEEQTKKQLQLEELIKNEKAAKDQATEKCQALQNALDVANDKQAASHD